MRLATQKSDGRQVAIKIIEKSNLEVNTDSLKTEVKILKSVGPTITDFNGFVQLLDYFSDTNFVLFVLRTGE